MQNSQAMLVSGSAGSRPCHQVSASFPLPLAWFPFMWVVFLHTLSLRMPTWQTSAQASTFVCNSSGKRIFHRSHEIESYWLRLGHMTSIPTTGQCIHRTDPGLPMPGAGIALTWSRSDGWKLGEGQAPGRSEGLADRRNGHPL